MLVRIELKLAGATGIRTRGLLRDRRSNQLNYAPATGSQIFSSSSSSNRAFFSADPDAKHICIASDLSKELAQAPGINFSRYIIVY